MKTTVLPGDTKALLGFNRKLSIYYSDLTGLTSGTGQAVIPPNAIGAATKTMLAGTLVGRWTAYMVTPFASSGGSITHLYLTIGDGSSATRFMGTTTLDLISAAGTWVGGVTALYLYAAADTIDITPTITGQTLASLNAGQVDIYYEELDLNPLIPIQQP